MKYDLDMNMEGWMKKGMLALIDVTFLLQKYNNSGGPEVIIDCQSLVPWKWVVVTLDAVLESGLRKVQFLTTKW